MQKCKTTTNIRYFTRFTHTALLNHAKCTILSCLPLFSFCFFFILFWFQKHGLLFMSYERIAFKLIIAITISETFISQFILQLLISKVRSRFHKIIQMKYSFFFRYFLACFLWTILLPLFYTSMYDVSTSEYIILICWHKVYACACVTYIFSRFIRMNSKFFSCYVFKQKTI